MSAQHEHAARFFDGVSGTYRDKYTRRSAFHHYFFNERLQKATRGLDPANADVLDIGSGTGNLFDFLAERSPGMRFHATDVSAGMLEQSRVPADNKFAGHAYDHPFATHSFDAIFMLGVTTYLSPSELEKNLGFMVRSLKPKGVVVITFSNKHGLDTWMRALLRWPMRLLGRKDRVLGSGLKLHTYSHGEVRSLMERHFTIVRSEGLNHTVFPFNLLVPFLAIPLARLLSRVDGAPTWLRWLSSDLLIRACKKELP